MHHSLYVSLWDDAADLDLAISMYNLLEYRSNYSDTAGRSWFYPKDKANNFNANIANTTAFKSFEYKAKLLRDTVAQPTPNNNNGWNSKICNNCCTIKISK